MTQCRMASQPDSLLFIPLIVSQLLKLCNMCFLQLFNLKQWFFLHSLFLTTTNSTFLITIVKNTQLDTYFLLCDIVLHLSKVAKYATNVISCIHEFFNNK